MIRAITIFTIGLAFMGLGGGFLLGAADLFDAFPERVVASGVSGENILTKELYQNISREGGAQFELLRIVTGTMGIEIFLRGLSSLNQQDFWVLFAYFMGILDEIFTGS